MKQQQLEQTLQTIEKAYHAYRDAYQNKVAYENSMSPRSETTQELMAAEFETRRNMLDTMHEVFGDG